MSYSRRRSRLAFCFALLTLMSVCVHGDDPESQNVVVVHSVKPTNRSSAVNTYGLTRRDFEVIKATIPTIQYAIPVRSIGIEARYRDQSAQIRLVGATEALSRVADVNMVRGRFLAASDVKNRETVAVVGSSVAKALFPNSDVIGKNIRVGDNYFLIIGELASVNKAGKRTTTMTNDDIFIPLTTMRSRMGDTLIKSNAGSFETEQFELSQIWLTVTDVGEINTTKAAVSALLEKTHERKDFTVRALVQNVPLQPGALVEGEGSRKPTPVHELGVVESAKVFEIRSPLQSTILTIVPEGARVKKNDLLVRLDTSGLEDQLNEQKMEVARSEAEVIEAEAVLSGQKFQTTADTEIAELRARVANLSLKQSVAEGGEIDMRMRQAESEIKIATARLRLAQRQLDTFEKGAIKGRQRDEVQFHIEEAAEEKKIAETKLRWLKDYVRPTQTAKLELALKEAEFAMIAAKQFAKGKLVKAEGIYQSRRFGLDSAKHKLDRLQEQLVRCSVRSPLDGVVQYASTRGRAGIGTIEEGASVRERQPLVRIADLNQLQVRVRVHESRIRRVRIGSPVVVHIDAFPDRKIQGTVATVNTTPEPSSWLSEGVKVYAVIVRLEAPPAGLRLGMTAMAEIVEE